MICNVFVLSTHLTHYQKNYIFVAKKIVYFYQMPVVVAEVAAVAVVVVTNKPSDTRQ